MKPLLSAGQKRFFHASGFRKNARHQKTRGADISENALRHAQTDASSDGKARFAKIRPAAQDYDLWG